MTTNKAPIFLNTVSGSNVSIANGDGTTQKNALVAGADGAAVTNLSATSDDTSDKTIVLQINDGSTSIVIGEVVVPDGSGTNGVDPAVNLLDAVALPGVLQADGSLILGAGCTLTLGAKVAVTAAKTINIHVQGGQYAA